MRYEPDTLVTKRTEGMGYINQFVCCWNDTDQESCRVGEAKRNPRKQLR
jgi:hypothetical protein